MDKKSLAVEIRSDRPLVVFLEWMAAQRNHVKKFTDLYLGSGYDVLVAPLTPSQLLFPKSGSQVGDIKNRTYFITDILRFRWKTLTHYDWVGFTVVSDNKVLELGRVIEMYDTGAGCRSGSVPGRQQSLLTHSGARILHRGIRLGWSTVATLSRLIKIFICHPASSWTSLGLGCWNGINHKRVSSGYFPQQLHTSYSIF